MKSLIAGMAGLVRRLPWLVIGITVVITVALSGLAQNLQQTEESNESFAPDAAELAAASRISELFGEDTTGSVMQVVLSSDGRNLYSVEGLAAVDAVEETVMNGALADRLVQDRPDPIVSFIFPVRFGDNSGADPSTDAELGQLFLDGYASMPPPQAGFVDLMVPSDADLAQPWTDQGLIVIFNVGGEEGADLERFQEESAAAADEIRATTLPDGFVAEPFSFELLFSDTDEFQSEIGRLFGTAGMIIMLVLALVFLVLPRRGLGRITALVGITAAIVAIVAVVLPTLGVILDSALPDGLKDWPTGQIFAGAGLLLLLLFLVWTFVDSGLRRTAADTVLTLITIFFAIAWMNGISYLLFEDSSPMAQLLPILLIGLGVDYSIHITNRYREELSGGSTVDDSVGGAISTVGIALALATIATAVGFLTNAFNEIPALREFGISAAIGIVSSFILMLTFVPAVRLILDRRGIRRGTLEKDRLAVGENRTLGRLIGRTSRLATKMPAVAVTASLLLGGVGLWGSIQLETRFSFLDFIPVTSPLRTTFEGLVEDFGGGFGESTTVLIEGDVSDAGAWNGMVQAYGDLVDTPDVLTFGNRPSGTSPVALIDRMAAQQGPAAAPAVSEALRALGADPANLTVPPGTDLSSVYDAAWEADPEAADAVLYRSDGSYEAALFEFTTQAGESRASELRLNLMDDFAGVEEAGLSAVATSDEIIQDVVVTTLRDSQVSSLTLTLLAALLLLTINFWVQSRRPVLGIITTVPVMLVVLWSFGLMALFGIPFGPVTATISALAIGIGIPYMIHITHRFLEDNQRYPDAETAMASTLSHTGGALAGSALTTVAGFGILVTSTTIPFRQFGFVTAYTILLAMAAAILMLPSLLVLWARWHKAREVRDSPA